MPYKNPEDKKRYNRKFSQTREGRERNLYRKERQADRLRKAVLYWQFLDTGRALPDLIKGLSKAQVEKGKRAWEREKKQPVEVIEQPRGANDEC